MNKNKKKKIREIVNLVMELNEFGVGLDIRITSDILDIVDTKNGFKSYLKDITMYSYVYFNEPFKKDIHNELDCVLQKLRKDLKFLKSLNINIKG